MFDKYYSQSPVPVLKACPISNEVLIQRRLPRVQVAQECAVCCWQDLNELSHFGSGCIDIVRGALFSRSTRKVQWQNKSVGGDGLLVSQGDGLKIITRPDADGDQKLCLFG